MRSAAAGDTPGSLYVWGINRGGARLPLGSPGIGAGLCSISVCVMFTDGSARVVVFQSMGPPVITPLVGGIDVSGSTLTGDIPFSLLPSNGVSAASYEYSLWVRKRVNPAMDGTNAELADFLPDAATFVAGVPEPSSWLVLVAGFGVMGIAARRRSPTRLRSTH
ncbi:PEP-CTERM sorting domain-containing protein [Sandaracinobacteroides hominis]|uniref:PEP-CTERM sorting domain-containing protein n=1 Tax=Sandaracinobacteroides hominis TaxID=2780086 RepID=UPI001A9C97F5|nr:PEP-CTERM sorting domain-containing protein [Sandaracinobacteroides hominis]